jgi:AcrR family transcriptional regulator
MAKERFLTAAERLFLQNGFEKTSADEVAKEAGFTKRTLYQYFESKEDLFFAVILPGAKRLFAAYEEAMSQGDCTLEKIRLGNQAHLRFFLDDRGCPSFELYARQ